MWNKDGTKVKHKAKEKRESERNTTGRWKWEQEETETEHKKTERENLLGITMAILYNSSETLQWKPFNSKSVYGYLFSMLTFESSFAQLDANKLDNESCLLLC